MGGAKEVPGVTAVLMVAPVVGIGVVAPVVGAVAPVVGAVARRQAKATLEAGNGSRTINGTRPMALWPLTVRQRTNLHT